MPTPIQTARFQRAARSQISTAVSFEGARAAGSAALPSRSLDGESALSAAEGDGEIDNHCLDVACLTIEVVAVGGGGGADGARGC